MKCVHKPEFWAFFVRSLYRSDYECRLCHEKITQTDVSSWIHRVLLYFPLYFILSDSKIRSMKIEVRVLTIVVISIIVLFVIQILSYLMVRFISCSNDHGDT